MRVEDTKGFHCEATGALAKLLYPERADVSRFLAAGSGATRLFACSITWQMYFDMRHACREALDLSSASSAANWHVLDFKGVNQQHKRTGARSSTKGQLEAVN